MTVPIILIGWLYVTILMAATETSFIAAVLTFTLYGGLPCGLILYFSGSKVRRARARHKEMLEEQQAQASIGASPRAETPQPVDKTGLDS